MSNGGAEDLRGAHPPHPHVWLFANARLSESDMTLCIDGQPVKLERKPLELLLHLLRNPQRLVRKDELLAAVWPGRILSDSAFTSCVAKLRDAFGPEGQNIVRTVHGYGYRLGVEVVRQECGPPTTPAPGDATSAAMPPAQQRSRRLAAIMFTDMVGYTSLVQRNESLGLRLLKRQRRIVRACLPGFGGREVEVIGDAFLVEFASALHAVECAVALQQLFAAGEADPRDGTRIQLRIGIHLGDILRPGKGVFGDSVNLAARLQTAAPEGGIAISGMVFDQIYNKITVDFEDRGELQLKGIDRPTRVYCANAETIGAASTPLPLSHWRWWRPRQSARWAAVVGLVVTLSVALLWQARDGGPSGDESTASIAVLPFANLSASEQDRFLADGVHDSVLSKLATIGSLKVIARSSVMQYRETRKTVAQIGNELSVTHTLEGTVQRHAGRVRVTAQLVEVRGANPIWSQTFEREDTDVFSIQTDIAQSVVAAVDLALAPADAAQLATAPTRDPQAHALYAQMLALEKHYRTPEILTQMETLLLQALALDPQFALAHAALAGTYMDWYRDGVDPDPARLAQARRSVDDALALRPDLAEAQLQLGAYYYEGLRDYANAERAFMRVLERMPNSAPTYEYLAYIRMDQARWAEATDLLEKAVELDPNQRWLRGALANAYIFERRFQEALRQVEIQERLVTDDPTVWLLRPFLRQAWTGEIETLRTTLAKLPDGLDSNPIVFDSRLRLAFAENRFDDAIAVIERCDCPWIAVYRASRHPKELLLGDALVAAGRETAAREAYQHALALIDQEVSRLPTHARNFAFRAWALRGLGRTQEALASVEHALQLVPSEDGWERLQVLIERARVLAAAGQANEALELMNRISQPPSPPYLHFWLQEPWTRQLREHPRMQSMIAEHRGATGQPPTQSRQPSS